MILLHRKEGNRGEIRVITTDLDRAALLIGGTQWININDVINDFNTDDKVNDLYITVSYSGDLKDEKLTELLQKTNFTQTLSSQKVNTESKTKVHSDGSEEKDDDNDEEELTKEEALKSILEDYDLTCPECNDKDKALLDCKGNVYPCKSCLQIDSFIEGKKKGFSEGFDAGYKAAMIEFEKITNNHKKEITNGTGN